MPDIGNTPEPSGFDHRPETRFRFAPMSLVDVDGKLRIPVRDDEFAHVMRRVDDPDIVETFTHARLHELAGRGLVREVIGALSTSAASLSARLPEQRLADMPAAVQKTINYRKGICDDVLRAEAAGECSRSDASLRAVIDASWLRYDREERRLASPGARCGKGAFTLNAPSSTTVRRWLRAYEAFNFDPRSLRPGYSRSGNTLPRLDSEEAVILRRVAERYASLRKPTKASLLLYMRALFDRLNRMRRAAGLRALVCPGKTALSNAIARLDEFHVYAAREGVEKARRRFHIVHRGLEVERPMERVEADEWKLQLHVILKRIGVWKEFNRRQRRAIEKARLWVSTVIDVRTRCFLALRLLRVPSAAGAVAALAMAVSDKSSYAQAAGCRTPWDMSGNIETLAADNGVFASHEYRNAVNDLRAECLFPQAGQPQMRGTKERSYRTLHDGFVSNFDGRSFKDIVEKGDYDSEANASLDTELIGHLLVRHVVDIYHNTPHKGLGGQTPRACWLELRKKYGVRPSPTPEECRAIFGTTVRRRITGDGLRFLGLRFQSPELQKERGGRIRKDVLFRIDPTELWEGAFWTKKGWRPVRCVREGMKGVSVEQWMLAVAEMRRRYADEASASEAEMLEAIRFVHASAEGARRRAGIASPILTAADYSRFERTLFKGFERADAENVDLLAVSHEVTAADPDPDSLPEAHSSASEVTAALRADPAEIQDVDGVEDFDPEDLDAENFTFDADATADAEEPERGTGTDDGAVDPDDLEWNLED